MQVKLEKFEGPLGLLLQLIEKEELDITEISLAKIADEYVASIKAMSSAHPDELADFLVVAAKLLLIKSKALLPYLYTEEDEDEIKEFEDQLRMYKEFLEASKYIEDLIGKKRFMFGREFSRQTITASTKLFSPPKKLSKDDLKVVFASLLIRLKPAEKLLEEKIERKVHLEEKILSIQEMLVKKLKVRFSQILATAESKTEIVVSFLAMLELIKQKEISAHQSGLFEEIEINKV